MFVNYQKNTGRPFSFQNAESQETVISKQLADLAGLFLLNSSKGGKPTTALNSGSLAVIKKCQKHLNLLRISSSRKLTPRNSQALLFPKILLREGPLESRKIVLGNRVLGKSSRGKNCASWLSNRRKSSLIQNLFLIKETLGTKLKLPKIIRINFAGKAKDDFPHGFSSIKYTKEASSVWLFTIHPGLLSRRLFLRS